MVASANNVFHLRTVTEGFELRFHVLKEKSLLVNGILPIVNIFGMVMKKGGRLPQGYTSWTWEELKNLGTAKIIKIPYIPVQTAF